MTPGLDFVRTDDVPTTGKEDPIARFGDKSSAGGPAAADIMLTEAASPVRPSNLNNHVLADYQSPTGEKSLPSQDTSARAHLIVRRPRKLSILWTDPFTPLPLLPNRENRDSLVPLDRLG
jgi:hypothetical protein